MPSVVMKALTPTRTTRTALTSPTVAAIPSVAMTAGSSGHPLLTVSEAMITWLRPTIDPMERSNSFVAKGMVRPIATINNTAWLPRIDCALLMVKNVLGSRIEKTAISSTRARSTEYV